MDSMKFSHGVLKKTMLSINTNEDKKLKLSPVKNEFYYRANSLSENRKRKWKQPVFKYYLTTVETSRLQSILNARIKFHKEKILHKYVIISLRICLKSVQIMIITESLKHLIIRKILNLG